MLLLLYILSFYQVVTIKIELIKTFEELGLRKEEVTIALVDAINMYPSIKLATIKEAVIFFERKLTRKVTKTINLCLDLIQFGMSSTPQAA